jgi:hypothetical protein
MSRRKSNDGKKERDKKGEQRMERFEKGQEKPIVKTTISNDEYEEYTITCYQKIEPGEWEKIEIPYKRKKR